MQNAQFEIASDDLITRDWEEFTGGPPVFGVLRHYLPSDVEGLTWQEPQGPGRGLVTWWVDAEVAEIVSLHASPTGRGTGALLMNAAESELRRRGVKQVVLATTNDNPRALSFCVRRGYRLVRLHLDAMDRVRQAKPHLPLIDNDGIPLRDMWELQKEL